MRVLVYNLLASEGSINSQKVNITFRCECIKILKLQNCFILKWLYLPNDVAIDVLLSKIHAPCISIFQNIILLLAGITFLENMQRHRVQNLNNFLQENPNRIKIGMYTQKNPVTIDSLICSVRYFNFPISSCKDSCAKCVHIFSLHSYQ